MAPGKDLVRPPGAVVEPEFFKRCIRCNACVDVCPVHGLRPAHLLSGIRNVGTPELGTFCMMYLGLEHPSPEGNLEWKTKTVEREPCLRCVRECPTQALQRIGIEDLNLGLAVLNRDTCWGWLYGSCLLCVPTCPVDAISSYRERNPTVDKGKCIGCGQCTFVCPVDPPAIIVIPEGANRIQP